IKDDRIARAVIHVEQQKTGRETDNPAQADDKPDTPKTDHKQVDLPPFNTALAMTIEKRLSVLRCNSVDAQLGTAPLPFVLSKAFSEHLMAIIAEHIAPALTAQAARIIERAYKLPDDERLDSIFTALNTKRHREALWEHWCAAWTTLTQQTKPPSKPEEQKKSVMGVFSKKPKRRPGQRELTLEEWEVACTVAQEDNASALVIWGKICQSSDDYQAPRGEDNTILMNLFARTPEAMDRQSTALYQIAGRGRDAPEAFEEYQKGKDVDTALLAGCYKDPNVFIASDFLSKIMRDYTDDVRHDKFPLTARYLASFMG
ncbi:MAG: hypothetical protein HOE65_08210, partial [Rhodospirillales bacterium]|nr:hypothetical protein [Rhodospirillales bacterium]